MLKKERKTCGKQTARLENIYQTAFKTTLDIT